MKIAPLEEEEDQALASGPGYRWRDLFRIPAVRMLIIVRVLSDPVWYFMLFWLPNYLVSERGFSMDLMGKTAWLPYVGVDIGLLLGGLAAGALIRRGSMPAARKAVSVGRADPGWHYFIPLRRQSFCHHLVDLNRRFCNGVVDVHHLSASLRSVPFRKRGFHLWVVGNRRSRRSNRIYRFGRGAG
jgi:hypothetical protein